METTTFAPGLNTPIQNSVNVSIKDALMVDLALRPPLKALNLPKSKETTDAYKTATPFSHLIIDNFIDQALAESISDELKSIDIKLTVSFNDDVQKNKMISTGESVPPFISLLAAKFASAEVLRSLEAITGLENLIPDPYYNTEYGYYHVVGPGGILGSHLDHSHHQSLGIPHVLNIVVYLSEEWDENDGGALCLFDDTGKKIVKKVPCKFNRAAIFAANPISYHGVEPIKADAKNKRHSLYFAYYSLKLLNQNSSEQIESVPTMYRKGELENNRINYGTYFVVPWYQLFRKKNLAHLKLRVRSAFKLFLPPIIPMIAKKLSGSK